VDLLAGIDDVSWSDLDHCYQSPDDYIPGLLRAIAFGSPDADEALETLSGFVFHQGSVYPLTAPLVPFFARFAVAGISPASLVHLIGICAEHDTADSGRVAEFGSREPVPGAIRAALAASVDVLAPLLGDQDDEVRRLTAWALAHCGVPGQAVPHLRLQWDVDTDRQVRRRCCGRSQSSIPR
jgi:hypothetical protein